MLIYILQHWWQTPIEKHKKLEGMWKQIVWEREKKEKDWRSKTLYLCEYIYYHPPFLSTVILGETTASPTHSRRRMQEPANHRMTSVWPGGVLGGFQSARGEKKKKIRKNKRSIGKQTSIRGASRKSVKKKLKG